VKIIVYREKSKFYMVKPKDWKSKLAYKIADAIINSARNCTIPGTTWRAMRDCQHTYTVQLYLKEVWSEGRVYKS
jgi:hypothetical protein